MQEELMYGDRDTECLIHTDPMDFVLERIDDFSVNNEEPFDDIADTMQWPIKVYEYRRMTLEKDIIAEEVLEYVLDRLDSEYSDPNGDNTEPTELMKKAADNFSDIIAKEYIPWACEHTGRIIEVTRDQAKNAYEEERL